MFYSPELPDSSDVSRMIGLWPRRHVNFALSCRDGARKSRRVLLRLQRQATFKEHLSSFLHAEGIQTRFPTVLLSIQKK